MYIYYKKNFNCIKTEGIDNNLYFGLVINTESLLSLILHGRVIQRQFKKYLRNN